MIREMIVCILATFVFVGCSTIQGGITKDGNISSTSTSTHNTTIIYQGLNKEQLIDELQKRDKRIADLEAKSKPRTLDAKTGAELETSLSRGKPIQVYAVMGDAEARQFAEQIQHYLEEKGYNVLGVAWELSNRTIVGHKVISQGEGFEVIVGGK